MQNEVTLKNDIVHIYVIGDQTATSVAAMGKDTLRLLKKLEAQSKPGLVLDDITLLGNTDMQARRGVVDLAKTLPYKRAAMLGDGSVLMRVGTNLMLKAMGKGDSVRYFENRDLAIAWLTAK